MTILRDPRERLRSKYHFRRHLEYPDALHHSFYEWLSLLQKDPETLFDFKRHHHEVVNLKKEACSEYVQFLGNMNVDQAKYVLATRFDLVGITEKMDETMVELARQLNKDPNSSVEVLHSRTSASEKTPWTNEQYALAGDLVSKDLELYIFAKRLMHARLMSAWGSEETLEQAIEKRVQHRRPTESSSEAATDEIALTTLNASSPSSCWSPQEVEEAKRRRKRGEGGFLHHGWEQASSTA